jgi:hypothetical protein
LDYAAVALAVLALVFTVSSFWWLNARKGSIEATKPRAYAADESPPPGRHAGRLGVPRFMDNGQGKRAAPTVERGQGRCRPAHDASERTSDELHP